MNTYACDILAMGMQFLITELLRGETRPMTGDLQPLEDPCGPSTALHEPDLQIGHESQSKGLHERDRELESAVEVHAALLDVPAVPFDVQ